MAQSKHSADKKREAVLRYRAGESPALIAADFGVSATAIKQWTKHKNKTARDAQPEQSAVDAMRSILRVKKYRIGKVPVKTFAPSQVDIFIYVGNLCVGAVECKTSVGSPGTGKRAESLAYSAIGQLMVYVRNSIVCGYPDNKAYKDGYDEDASDIARLLRALANVPTPPMAVAFAPSMTIEGSVSFGADIDDAREDMFRGWFGALGIDMIVCGLNDWNGEQYAYDDGLQKFLNRLHEYRSLVQVNIENAVAALDITFDFLRVLQIGNLNGADCEKTETSLGVLEELYDSFPICDRADRPRANNLKEIRRYLCAIGVERIRDKQPYKEALQRISRLKRRLREDLRGLTSMT